MLVGFSNNWPVLTAVFLLFLLQNWMAFTNLRVDNFTITDSLVFTNTISPSNQDNFAFCQVRILPAQSIFGAYPNRLYNRASKVQQKLNAFETMQEVKIDC